MPPQIFILRNGDLTQMEEDPFESEDALQALLERHPAILGVDQHEPGRGWFILVRREEGIPGEEAGADRWAVDHLFLDRDGVPTLVEVKRSNDTRTRRNVVGQMLDYAANALAYWPADRLRADFMERWREHSEEVLRGFIGPDDDVEGFWSRVETNLRAGRLRLVFVADGIPTELQRIVEFLNDQLESTEVLAISIVRYQGSGMATVVSDPVGRTAGAEQRKRVGETRRWDESSFFLELAQRFDEATVCGIRRLYDWALQHMGIRWGTGKKVGTFVIEFSHGDETHAPLQVSTDGNTFVRFFDIAAKPRFADRKGRILMLERLNTIPGVGLPHRVIESMWEASIPVEVFRNQKGLEGLLSALEWYRRQVDESDPDWGEGQRCRITKREAVQASDGTNRGTVFPKHGGPLQDGGEGERRVPLPILRVLQ